MSEHRTLTAIERNRLDRLVTIAHARGSNIVVSAPRRCPARFGFLPAVGEQLVWTDSLDHIEDMLGA